MKLRLLIYSLILSAACAAPARGAEPEAVDELSMTLEENIAYPAVAAKKARPVTEAMGELSKKLKALGFATAMERNGEVVRLTIPASDLFRANARELSPEGRKKLEKLERYVSHREQFKVLVAVHTDDTGDEQYADELSSDRANAIDGYFTKELGREPNLIPYGLGHDEPLANDVTVKNRAANRRVEIFFVPTIAYIKHLTK